MPGWGGYHPAFVAFVFPSTPNPKKERNTRPNYTHTQSAPHSRLNSTHPTAKPPRPRPRPCPAAGPSSRASVAACARWQSPRMGGDRRVKAARWRSRRSKVRASGLCCVVLFLGVVCRLGLASKQAYEMGCDVLCQSVHFTCTDRHPPSNTRPNQYTCPPTHLVAARRGQARRRPASM